MTESLKKEAREEIKEMVIRSLFTGEEIDIRKIFKLAPKRQCYVDWEHLERVIDKLIDKSALLGYEKGRTKCLEQHGLEQIKEDAALAQKKKDAEIVRSKIIIGSEDEQKLRAISTAILDDHE